MQQSKDKLKHFPALINFFILIISLGYMVFFWKQYPFAIGGPQIFLSVIAFLIYISAVKKEIAVECSILSFVLFLVMAINFLATLEYNIRYSINIDIIIGIAIVVISLLVYHMTKIPLNWERKEVLSAEEEDLKKRISSLLYHAAWITQVYVLLTLPGVIALRENKIIGKECSLNFIYSLLSWLIIGLIFTLLLMKRWAFLEKYIAFLVKRKIEINIAPIKRCFFPGAIIIFLLGIPFEMQRGLLFLWFLSWLSCVLISMMIFKVWQYVFEQPSPPIAIDSEKVERLPLISNPAYMIKIALINVPVAIFYALVLVFLEEVACK